MKKTITIVLVLAFIGCKKTANNISLSGSEGCAIEKKVATGKITIIKKIADADRKYILSIPEDYDPKTPYKLIFIWHALNQKIENLYPSKLEKISAGGAIFVYPQGLEYLSAGLGWYTNNGSIDLKFYDDLYRNITANYCIDKSQVFSYGHSFGALMSNSLACFRGDQLKAVSSVSGINYFENSSCDFNTNMIISHGKSDDHPVVNYTNGLKSLEFWKRNQQCSDDFTINEIGCQVFRRCIKNLTWCPYDGGHRKWKKADAVTWDYFRNL